MAKRNSTKTASKEALSSSEPRVLIYNQWTGISIKDVPLNWHELDEANHNQADLMDNFLHLQNNIDTVQGNKTLETRSDTIRIANTPSGSTLTGVACLHEDRLIVATDDNKLWWTTLGTGLNNWTEIPATDADTNLPASKSWTHIGYYQQSLIGLTDEAEIYVGDILTDSTYYQSVSSSKRITNPSTGPTLTKKGSLSDGTVTRLSIAYTCTNVFGQTLPSQYTTLYVDANPVEWSAKKYLTVSGTAPTNQGVTGIDLYCVFDENQDAIFIGHTLPNADGTWSFNWLGALSDTSVWTNVSLTVPTENSTKGVSARHFRHHDGRLYFWGGTEKYRLYIGGNPGNELSVARGVGGAFVDIEPGTGTEVHGTHKFKTYNGASIVTVMCGNPNTQSVKRFNLLETNTTITTEISHKGYMWEEVSNVVGCNSDWGSGVWADGLYSVSRYGLALTTQAMESSNQLRTMYVSDNIMTLFSYRLGRRLNDARMMQIKDIVYIVLSEDPDDEPGNPPETSLDKVILCYDIGMKAWYTYTIDTNDRILHIMHIDSEDHWEGIGVITENNVLCIPTTSRQTVNAPEFDVILETGELSSRSPLQETTYLNQLEVKFDYFIGECDILIDMVDYYGRHVTVEKHIHEDQLRYDWTEWIRIDKLVESYRIILKGPARFRLTHFLAKTYGQSKKINQVYGFNDRVSYINRNGGTNEHHHYIKDYNNLREAIVT